MWVPNTVPLACMSCAGCVPRGWWRSQHQLHSVVLLQAALRTVGAAEGRLRGGCLPPLWGASEFRLFPFPGCPPSGRAAGVRYPRAMGAGVQAWGPGTVFLARMPHVELRAAGGVEGRPRGGSAFHRCEGCPMSGAVPPPAPRPLGSGRGSATRVSWVRLVWAWGPSTGPTP